MKISKKFIKLFQNCTVTLTNRNIILASNTSLPAGQALKKYYYSAEIINIYSNSGIIEKSGILTPGSILFALNPFKKKEEEDLKSVENANHFKSVISWDCDVCGDKNDFSLKKCTLCGSTHKLE